MPTSSQHIDKAKSDERCAIQISQLSSPFYDWIVNAYFYAALHYIDASLAQLHLHPQTHSARNRTFSSVSAIRHLWKDYRFLEDKSRDARYTEQTFTAQNIDNAIMPRFNAIKNKILTDVVP